MSGLLECELRRNLLEVVARTPGLTVGQVAGDLGVHYKTAVHHSRRLADAGHLVLRREGRRTYCYLPGVPAPPPSRVTPRMLLAVAALAGGARTPAALARSLGVPRGTAGSMLKALERAALARRSPEGFHLAEDVKAAILAPEAFTAKAMLGRSWSPSSSAR